MKLSTRIVWIIEKKEENTKKNAKKREGQKLTMLELK